MAITRFQRRPMRTSQPGFPPTASFDELANRVRSMFDDSFLPMEGMDAPSFTWLPATDVSETPEAVTITTELPGMDRKDVDIAVDDGILTIRGNKADTHVSENKTFHYAERTWGSFERSFTLPRTVDASKINATFGKGVLTVLLPKTAEAKAKTRKIEVNEQQ